MQYRVPQNIDMEDKIVGPLTLKQFIYIAIGGALVYIVITKMPSPISFILALPMALFILALTFYKPQDQPFSHFLTALFQYMAKPKQRIWIKGTVEEAVILPHKETVKNVAAPKKKVTKSDLQKLTQILDSGGWQALEKTETPHTTQKEMESEQARTSKEAAQLKNLEAQKNVQQDVPDQTNQNLVQK